MPSIFTKIIVGLIPGYKIYEDSRTIAFLDIQPIIDGHTLVVPKVEVDQLWDLDHETYQALMATTQKVAVHLRKVLGTSRVGVKVMGNDVPHAHVHLIPYDRPEQFHVSHSSLPPDHPALQAMQKRLTL